MNQLGNGLHEARHHADALTVREADLAIRLRLGMPARRLLVVRGNIATSYRMLGREEEAMRMLRDVYYGRVKLHGKEHAETLREANNYADLLKNLKRFEEAKALLRQMIPMSRRVLGESAQITLKMRTIYALVLREDPGATLDNLREAVEMFEETARIARRVLGGAHPLTADIERALQQSREVLRAREGDDVSAVRAGLDAMKAT